MSYDKPSILLAELWERESKHGNVYYSGFWGNLSVALLRDGERPHPTRPDETITVWMRAPLTRCATETAAG